MNDVPIFDSLTHPMPNGNWISSKYDNKNHMDDLVRGMKSNGINWAICCGLGSKIGNYNLYDYSKLVAQTRNKHGVHLESVAFIDEEIFHSKSQEEQIATLKLIKDLGYVGIKLHPGISNFEFSSKKLKVLVEMSNKANLIPFLCTYTSRDSCCNQSNIRDLYSLLSSIPKNSKLILVHSGGAKLLEYIELARAFPNVLLDLSFTLCKYEGSSIDLDLKYCFHQFDQRVCIGSDGPEFSSQNLRERFNSLSSGLSLEKKKNIAYMNMLKYLGIRNEQ